MHWDRWDDVCIRRQGWQSSVHWGNPVNWAHDWTNRPEVIWNCLPLGSLNQRLSLFFFPFVRRKLESPRWKRWCAVGPQAAVQLANYWSVVRPDSLPERLVEGAGLQQMFCCLTASTTMALLCMANAEFGVYVVVGVVVACHLLHCMFGLA